MNLRIPYFRNSQTKSNLFSLEPQDFRWNTSNDSIVWNRFINHRVCTNCDIISYCNAAKNNSAFIDMDIIFNNGNPRVFSIASPDCNLLSYSTVTPYPTILMDDNADTSISESRSGAYHCLIWNLAIIN